MLGLPEADLGPWRDAIKQAVGSNGQLVAALIPELEGIVGPQPAVPELPAQDAQNRFQMVFRRFLGVFAKKEHPLALFLDDLQWLDTATLKLIEHLVSHAETRHLLLIGAYRNNEVDPCHPLMLTLDSIRKTQAKVSEILLAPSASMTSAGSSPMRCTASPHARDRSPGWCTRKPREPVLLHPVPHHAGRGTAGGVRRAHRGVALDVQRIEGKGFTDNVVELMIAKLKRLPGPTSRR